jgi:NADH-quinone oxidoreductase subunit H
VGEFDAFADGYPVPPTGDQVLPEFAQVLTGQEDVAADPPASERQPDEQPAREGSEA